MLVRRTVFFKNNDKNKLSIPEPTLGRDMCRERERDRERERERERERDPKWKKRSRDRIFVYNVS